MRNREILFKAKRIDNGEWVEGVPISTHIGTFMVFEENPHYCSQYGYMEIDGLCKVDSNTLCEYTGLMDSNGNKIWENDIVNCPQEECCGKITWNEYEAGFYFFILMGDGLFEEENLYDYVDVIYVIGNTFDNPELLESEVEE